MDGVRNSYCVFNVRQLLGQMHWRTPIGYILAEQWKEIETAEVLSECKHVAGCAASSNGMGLGRHCTMDSYGHVCPEIVCGLDQVGEYPLSSFTNLICIS